MADNISENRTSEAMIERDVVRTQDQIGDTVAKIEDKLNPRDAARDLMGEDAMDTAKEALEVARRNPLPVALIAVGAVWLFATSDAPMIRELRNRLTGRGGRASSPERGPVGPPRSAGETFDRRADFAAI
jgi:hypothetical protein